MHDCDEKIATLKDDIRDATGNAKAQLSYAEKWISAAAEALELRFQIKPTPLPNADHERRVHDEIARTYELQTKEREELLEHWKIKYAEDTAGISRHVMEQREKLRVTSARRLELQKLYDLHAGEMRAWLTFKRERAARLAREQHAKAAATRIQSWWRGLMVRRALGAFKHLRNSKKAAVKKKK
ncbi:PREDICTED: IQ domain-containing protein G-like [Papilio polytes]|uniref:IQ domain-containing protein G-like n=1 Tax=Papilio polytes TaxID=76194 RepID=UPI0006768B72|nr:PREDICTED: IQ domain-containing protein G-like [Papilio polytes]